jgi:hypothetical protein
MGIGPISIAGQAIIISHYTNIPNGLRGWDRTSVIPVPKTGTIPLGDTQMVPLRRIKLRFKD